MSFDIGDKVICVNDKRTDYKAALLFQQWPVKGDKYTVRGFTDNDGIVTGMWLEEIHNRPCFQKLLNKEQEPAFALWRFEKLKGISAEEKSVLQEIRGNTKEVKKYTMIEECGPFPNFKP